MTEPTTYHWTVKPVYWEISRKDCERQGLSCLPVSPVNGPFNTAGEAYTDAVKFCGWQAHQIDIVPLK